MIIISRPRKLARTPTYYYYTKFKWIVTLIIVYQHFCKVVEKRGELKMKVVCQFNFDQHFQMLTFLMVLINLFAKFSPNFVRKALFVPLVTISSALFLTVLVFTLCHLLACCCLFACPCLVGNSRILLSSLVSTASGRFLLLTLYWYER